MDFGESFGGFHPEDGGWGLGIWYRGELRYFVNLDRFHLGHLTVGCLKSPVMICSSSGEAYDMTTAGSAMLNTCYFE
jgi:hypothetical protein